MRKAKTADSLQFERALVRLEQIVEQMESGEMDLDKSLALYQEGMELMAKCRAKLEEARKKIKLIARDSQGKLKLEDQDLEDN